MCTAEINTLFYVLFMELDLLDPESKTLPFHITSLSLCHPPLSCSPPENPLFFWPASIIAILASIIAILALIIAILASTIVILVLIIAILGADPKESEDENILTSFGR